MPGHGEMEHVRLVFIHGLVIVVRIEHRHVLFPGFVAIYPVTKDIYLIKTLLAVVGIPEHRRHGGRRTICRGNCTAPGRARRRP